MRAIASGARKRKKAIFSNDCEKDSEGDRVMIAAPTVLKAVRFRRSGGKAQLSRIARKAASESTSVQVGRKGDLPPPGAHYDQTSFTDRYYLIVPVAMRSTSLMVIACAFNPHVNSRAFPSAAL